MIDDDGEGDRKNDDDDDNDFFFALTVSLERSLNSNEISFIR